MLSLKVSTNKRDTLVLLLKKKMMFKFPLMSCSFKINPTLLFTQLEGLCMLKQTIAPQIFQGCLPQILLGSFLNTLSHIKVADITIDCIQLRLGT